MHVMQCDALQRTHPICNANARLRGLFEHVKEYTQDGGFKHLYRLERGFNQNELSDQLTGRRAEALSLATSSAPAQELIALFRGVFS
jgi:hypothetical protein